MEEITIKDIVVKVVECLKASQDGVSAKGISREKRVPLQKVYDVLSVLNGFPNEVTPLVTKNKKVFALEGSGLDGADKLIVDELQQARIRIKKMRIALEYMKSLEKAEDFSKEDLLKKFEFFEVELPQNYIF